MDCVGIIAEFNPLHNGHKYALEKAKELSGCKHIMAVMSGNFVQRGDIAIFDKFTRAKCALMTGAAIVVELPVCFSLANAERFAAGAVSILNKSGIVSSIAFGAETDDLNELSRVADMMNASKSNSNALFKANLKSGMSYPRALSNALGINGTLSPNNILAIEYLRALGALDSCIKPYIIKRTAVGHDCLNLVEGEYQSASFIRDGIRKNGVLSCKQYIPQEIEVEFCNATPHYLNSISDVIIYSLRRNSNLNLLPDVSEGFENVIKRSCRQSSDITEFLSKAKTKRFTMARIRRIMLYSLLGIDANFMTSNPMPLYIRVLGIRKEALPLLSELSHNSSLPVIKDYSDTKKLSDAAKAQLALEVSSDEIYNMSASKRTPVVNDFSLPLLII